MITEKLFYNDSYISTFDATVLSCVESAEYYKIILDKTAFFYEGGGQKADTGYIGDAFVYDVQEIDGEIVHFSKKQLTENSVYSCKIDWSTRFKRMQQHSGEHIVSGIVNSMYGYDNVGFHMEDCYVTIDFNGELTREQLDDIEDKANEAIYKNYSIKCYFPNEDELKTLNYRSKLELTENVRLVEIENTDLCACCAPHVNKTGEIGVIKILDFMRHRGGIRLVMKSGFDALHDYREKYKRVYEISNLLSAKQTDISVAVERLQSELDNKNREFISFKNSVALNARKSLVFSGDYSYYFTENFDTDMMRDIVNFGMAKSRICYVFCGNDIDGYSYVIGSETVDFKGFAKAFNSALNGRGGGRDTMIQGKVSSVKNDIINFINSYDSEVKNV